MPVNLYFEMRNVVRGVERENNYCTGAVVISNKMLSYRRETALQGAL